MSPDSRFLGATTARMSKSSVRATATIRLAEQKDFVPILGLARLVAAAGDTFPWEDFGTGFDKGVSEKEEEELALLAETWLPEPGQHRVAFVCEVEDCSGIAGVYVLQPNGLGRCRHVAQGAYMVTPSMRGRGIGKQLCVHSLGEAQKQQYIGMQFDMVVSTNFAAIKAFSSCGFKIMCTLPGVFRHPEEGLVGAHVMFHGFGSVETQVTHSRRVSSAPELRNGVSSVMQVQSSMPSAPTWQPTFEYQVGNVSLVVGDEVNLLPESLLSTESTSQPSGLHCPLKVEPPLPEGLSLCPITGTIYGSPVRPCPKTTYHITSDANAEVTFQVRDVVRSKPRPSEATIHINEDFAEQLENILHVADMPKEPLKTRAFGDWMIWMVHRAWLNDPSLVDFSFNSMHMPAPHLEGRIAPKLMKAMQTNSYIEVLSLSNANVQKSTALELAQALRQNCTVRTLNLEANCLDSNSIREIALSIRDNSATTLEQLRLQHQRQMGSVFGRPAEEAVGQMMQKNQTLVKLGFECDDAHWRNAIDRALVRNTDFSRRRQQMSTTGAGAPDIPSEDRTLGQLAFQACPAATASKFFNDSDPHHALLRAYMAQNLQLPTTTQLQHYAKSCGTSVPYTRAAPLIRQCRTWLLDTSVKSEVLVVDAFGMNTEGTLKAWQENGERWIVDLSIEDGGRLTFKSDRGDPSIFLSESWSAWLSQNNHPSDGGA